MKVTLHGLLQHMIIQIKILMHFKALKKLIAKRNSSSIT
jgi:hypothetical protein